MLSWPRPLSLYSWLFVPDSESVKLALVFCGDICKTVFCPFDSMQCTRCSDVLLWAHLPIDGLRTCIQHSHSLYHHQSRGKNFYVFFAIFFVSCRIKFYLQSLTDFGNATLMNFEPTFHFYSPWKRQKTRSFLTFSGGIEMEHWLDMGWNVIHYRQILTQKESNER